MIDDELTSVEIAEQLRNVVSENTVRRWSNLYEETGAIHLKKSVGRPQTVRTKDLIRKVNKRLAYRGQRSARHLAKIESGGVIRIKTDIFHFVFVCSPPFS